VIARFLEDNQSRKCAKASEHCTHGFVNFPCMRWACGRVYCAHHFRGFHRTEGRYKHFQLFLCCYEQAEREDVGFLAWLDDLTIEYYRLRELFHQLRTGGVLQDGEDRYHLRGEAEGDRHSRNQMVLLLDERLNKAWQTTQAHARYETFYSHPTTHRRGNYQSYYTYLLPLQSELEEKVRFANYAQLQTILHAHGLQPFEPKKRTKRTKARPVVIDLEERPQKPVHTLVNPPPPPVQNVFRGRRSLVGGEKTLVQVRGETQERELTRVEEPNAPVDPQLVESLVVLEDQSIFAAVERVPNRTAHLAMALTQMNAGIDALQAQKLHLDLKIKKKQKQLLVDAAFSYRIKEEVVGLSQRLSKRGQQALPPPSGTPQEDTKMRIEEPRHTPPHPPLVPPYMAPLDLNQGKPTVAENAPGLGSKERIAAPGSENR